MISLPRTVVYRLLKINMDHITKNNRIIGAKDLKIDIQIPFYIEINKSKLKRFYLKISVIATEQQFLTALIN